MNFPTEPPPIGWKAELRSEALSSSEHRRRPQEHERAAQAPLLCPRETEGRGELGRVPGVRPRLSKVCAHVLTTPAR